MNIQSKINKLLLALRYKGIILKINTEQFLNKEENKMITKYIVYDDHPKKDGEIFYSKIKLLEYLVDLYKRVGVDNG